MVKPHSDQLRYYDYTICGNSKYDENDRYGALIWDDSMMAAVNAVGAKCCTVVDGKVELTLNTERTINEVEKINENFSNAN